MATKDWRQRDKDYWGNEKTGEVIWVGRRDYRGKKRYAMWNNPGVLIKTFKTKSQALKFVKNYMRKN